MICPYRKRTETVDGTTSEYYMECYGAECPHYVESQRNATGFESQPYCNRAPYEFIHTQRGGRLYFLWEREKSPCKREEYQRMFNEELEKINGSIGEVKEDNTLTHE